MWQQHRSDRPSEDQLEAIVERALVGYHRDDRHGGACGTDERMLDAELVPVAREAFLGADELPEDAEVLRTFSETMRLLGEGYNVIALADPLRKRKIP